MAPAFLAGALVAAIGWKLARVRGAVVVFR
jgi:hypothetical protein